MARPSLEACSSSPVRGARSSLPRAVRRRASALVSRQTARVRAVLLVFRARHRVRAVGMGEARQRCALLHARSAMPGDRFGGEAMNMIDTARDALRATGATVLEALGSNGRVDEVRSPGGLTRAAEGSESIIGLRAGSPGRRVAGSPGRRVAQSASCIRGPLSPASLPA